MTSSGADAHDNGHDHQRTMLERLTFFSDAVFAIAITLLVIEVRAPELHHATDAALAQALANLIPKYVGFLVSFLVVGRFWIGHHRAFGMLKASDQRLVWTNLFLLLAVAFMPFPTAVFSEYAQLRVGVGIYTGWLTLLGLLNVAVIRAALSNPALVRDGVDGAAIRLMRRASWTPVVIGVGAFILGMVTPLLSLAALIVGSPVIGYIARHWEDRRQGMPVNPG